MNERYMELVRRHGQLMGELKRVRAEMAGHDPRPAKEVARIALRPDDHEADPLAYATLMDDIVVRNPYMFRAEQMDTNWWWVCCYLDEYTMDRICWSVVARGKPKRLEWTTTEFPSNATYEHLSGDLGVGE